MPRLHVALLLGLASGAAAQSPARPEPIKDNSFLIEEAYNQPAGVVQHISTLALPREGGAWAYSFTQEWPVRSIRHQVSFTVPVLKTRVGAAARHGVGDVALNYRYQLQGADGGPLAVAPRLSVLLPTGSATHGFGAGGSGLQANLPVSVEIGDRLVSHSNAGATLTPSARDGDGNRQATTSYSLGQSFIWLATPTVNLMLEAAFARSELVAGPGSVAAVRTFVVSPGVRLARTLASGLQIVPGVAVPIGVGPSRGERSLFAYLSLEHPF
ncbi:MAG: hypothetical protein JWL60_161 [Gemmatimonadetes bacterium]|jgi:hypothetical protein|nr:hypothetical protein [Gemmatimonadota bacterium]